MLAGNGAARGKHSDSRQLLSSRAVGHGKEQQSEKQQTNYGPVHRLIITALGFSPVVTEWSIKFPILWEDCSTREEDREKCLASGGWLYHQAHSGELYAVIEKMLGDTPKPEPAEVSISV